MARAGSSRKASGGVGGDAARAPAPARRPFRPLHRGLPHATHGPFPPTAGINGRITEPRPLSVPVRKKEWQCRRACGSREPGGVEGGSGGRSGAAPASLLAHTRGAGSAAVIPVASAVRLLLNKTRYRAPYPRFPRSSSTSATPSPTSPTHHLSTDQPPKQPPCPMPQVPEVLQKANS